MNVQRSSASLNLESFLQPNSMITPGVAGGMVTLIANTAWMQFDLPAKWVALLVSACFGFLVLKGLSASLYTRGIYFLLNTLIIFSMAMGTNTAAVQIATSPGNEDAVDQQAVIHLFPIAIADNDLPQQTYTQEELEKLRKQRDLIRRLEQEGILDRPASENARSQPSNTKSALPTRGGSISAELSSPPPSQADKETTSRDSKAESDNKSKTAATGNTTKKSSRKFFHPW